MKNLYKQFVFIALFFAQNLWAEAHPFHYKNILEMRLAHKNSFYLYGVSGKSFEAEECNSHWLVHLDDEGKVLWEFSLDYFIPEKSDFAFNRTYFNALNNRKTAIFKQRHLKSSQQTQLNLQILNSVGRIISNDTSKLKGLVGVDVFKVFPNDKMILLGRKYWQEKNTLWFAEMDLNGDIIWEQEIDQNKQKVFLQGVWGESSKNFRILTMRFAEGGYNGIQIFSIRNGKWDNSIQKNPLKEFPKMFISEPISTNETILFTQSWIYDSLGKKYHTDVKSYFINENQIKEFPKIRLPSFTSKMSVFHTDENSLKLYLSDRYKQRLWELNYSESGAFLNKKKWGNDNMPMSGDVVVLPSGHKIYSLIDQIPWNKDFELIKWDRKNKSIWRKDLSTAVVSPYCILEKE